MMSNATTEHTEQAVFADSSSDSSKDSVYDLGAAGWFHSVLPRIESQVLSGEWEEKGYGAPPVQFVQHAGETVVVPAGWWHVVLNLDCTVCVTQNFAAPLHYPKVASEVYAEAGTRPRVEAAVADFWRQKVLSSWPWLRHFVQGRCVHCAQRTRLECRMLQCRPVCAACGASRKEYRVISMEEAERKYAVTLWKEAGDRALPYMEAAGGGGGGGGGDEAGWGKKKLQRFYLESHVEEYAAEDHGSVAEAQCVATARETMKVRQKEMGQGQGGSGKRGHGGKGKVKGKGKATGKGGKYNKHRDSGGRQMSNKHREEDGRTADLDRAISCLSLVDSGSESDGNA
jgi:hypothetical protein